MEELRKKDLEINQIVQENIKSSRQNLNIGEKLQRRKTLVMSRNSSRKIGTSFSEIRNKPA
jgi:hypothetical protein